MPIKTMPPVRSAIRKSACKFSGELWSDPAVAKQFPEPSPTHNASGRESVQVALSVVISALATGQLETKRATARLQLASMNAANLHLRPLASDVVRTFQSTPEGLELAEPGATCDIISPDEYNEYEDEDHEDDDDTEGDF